MQQSPFWEANSFLGVQEIACIILKPDVHYPFHNSQLLFFPILNQTDSALKTNLYGA
jgi:hypothetical protein